MLPRHDVDTGDAVWDFDFGDVFPSAAASAVYADDAGADVVVSLEGEAHVVRVSLSETVDHSTCDDKLSAHSQKSCYDQREGLGGPGSQCRRRRWRRKRWCSQTCHMVGEGHTECATDAYVGVGWCRSSLDAEVEGVATASECWETCSRAHWDLVAIDFDGASKECFCQNDCECLAEADGAERTVLARVGYELPIACGASDSYPDLNRGCGGAREDAVLDDVNADSSGDCWDACLRARGDAVVVASEWRRGTGECACHEACECLAERDDTSLKTTRGFELPSTCAPPTAAPSPEPSSAPTACVDRGDWHKKGVPTNDCAWVGDLAHKRCTFDGGKGVKGEDGTWSSTACCATCSKSPEPTRAPTTREPTHPPVPVPRPRPTAAFVGDMPPWEEVRGFAGLDFKLTGGHGGDVVEATDGDDLAAYLETEAPLIILVKGALKLPSTFARMRSDKTLLGVGADATIGDPRCVVLNPSTTLQFEGVRSPGSAMGESDLREVPRELDER